MTCALAADAKVETPEGALTVRGLAGKRVPVFTREANRVRFRMMDNIRVLAQAQPVLRIRLDTGTSFRAGPTQMVFKRGMVECPAAELRPGDALEPAFSYPEGYQYRDDASQELRTSDGAVHVASVEPDGTADVYGFSVNVSGNFLVAAGVLCRAETA